MGIKQLIIDSKAPILFRISTSLKLELGLYYATTYGTHTFFFLDYIEIAVSYTHSPHHLKSDEIQYFSFLSLTSVSESTFIPSQT